MRADCIADHTFSGVIAKPTVEINSDLDLLAPHGATHLIGIKRDRGAIRRYRQISNEHVDCVRVNLGS